MSSTRTFNSKSETFFSEWDTYVDYAHKQRGSPFLHNFTLTWWCGTTFQVNSVGLSDSNASFKRKLSKREKKQLKKQEKLSRLRSENGEKDKDGVAEKLYTGEEDDWWMYVPRLAWVISYEVIKIITRTNVFITEIDIGRENKYFCSLCCSFTCVTLRPINVW